MKAGDQIYLNGANFKVDRKVSIELLNKSKFLLDNHMLKAEDANSPLKQLYFSIQIMLVNATDPDEAKLLYGDLLRGLLEHNTNPQVHKLIQQVDYLINQGKEFNALQLLRSNFENESDFVGTCRRMS
ncbi:MAG: flagellar biosynthesis repressor FlbT [Pseudomonadota bacterium]